MCLTGTNFDSEINSRSFKSRSLMQAIYQIYVCKKLEKNKIISKCLQQDRRYVTLVLVSELRGWGYHRCKYFASLGQHSCPSHLDHLPPSSMSPAVPLVIPTPIPPSPPQEPNIINLQTAKQECRIKLCRLPVLRGFFFIEILNIFCSKTSCRKQICTELKFLLFVLFGFRSY